MSKKTTVKTPKAKKPSQLDEAKAVMDAQAEIIETLAAENEVLKAAPAGTAPAAMTAETFEVGGIEYRFKIAKFRTEFGIETAANAINNRRLLEHLVFIGAGVIEKV